jgi:hypothetical protein
MLDGFGGSVMITLGILSLLTIAIAVSWTLARKRRRAARSRHDDIPLFTVPATALVPPIRRPPADAGGALRNTPPAFEPLARPAARPPAMNVEARQPVGSPTIRTRDGEVSTILRPRPEPPPAVLEDEGLGEAVDGASVRYWRVADGTLQFLPGRMTIAAGQDAGHEIRFVRTAGPDGTRITFGRAEGAPYRHVQLREPTVSRAHARMSLDVSVGGTPRTMPGNTGRWTLENLSSTNPVVVNGKALGSDGTAGASVILSDGDRIEMGEVAFVFHAR